MQFPKYFNLTGRLATDETMALPTEHDAARLSLAASGAVSLDCVRRDAPPATGSLWCGNVIYGPRELNVAEIRAALGVPDDINVLCLRYFFIRDALWAGRRVPDNVPSARYRERGTSAE